MVVPMTDSKPVVSQEDRDAIEDLGLADVVERAEEFALPNVDIGIRDAS